YRTPRPRVRPSRDQRSRSNTFLHRSCTMTHRPLGPILGAAGLIALAITSPALADTPVPAPSPLPGVNGADTAWMLISTALVLLMTPALAFFYGGLVRSKKMLNTMMMSYIALGVITVAWALIGYSLAFAPGSGSLHRYLGGTGFALLRGVGATPVAF